MKVYVVTDPEAGWDCVNEVFETYELAEKYCENWEKGWSYMDGMLRIHEKTIITK